MNQLEIHEKVDELIKKADEDIEITFSRMLKEILVELDDLYKKYGNKDGEMSYTDVNKYNRLNNMLKRITQMMGEEYQELSYAIQQTQQSVYLQTYLMQSYLTEQFSQTDLGIQIPTPNIISAALANPVELLKIPSVMQSQRDEIVRTVRIAVTQGIVAGYGYYKIAEELEQKLGYSKSRARTVARTEGARSMSIADNDVYEKVMAEGYKAVERNKNSGDTGANRVYVPRLTKVWLSSLDNRVRISHRKLDGQKADKDGLFWSGGESAPGPVLFANPALSVNCRCVLIFLVNNMIPTARRGRDYRDKDYQEKLKKRIDEYLEKGKTYAQALKLADKEVSAPSKEIPYVTYDEWYKQLG